MAVVTRRGAHGKVYWIAFYAVDGKQVWERVGTDKREAEALDRLRKREVRDGTYERGRRPTMPFGEYLKDWLTKRRNRNRDEERRQAERFLLSREWLARVPCEDLRPRHSVQLVEELKATISQETGRPIGEKYISNLYGIYRTAVRDARVAELIHVDPCVLPRGLLRRTARQGTRVPYAWSEVLALTEIVDVPRAANVLASLALFTGMREGEVCGRRWRDLEDASPLACLNVISQYDDQPLKTERSRGEHARKVPVHPLLGAMLRAWWHDGFEFTYCRPPTRDDFIVPRTKDGKPHTRSSAYKVWRSACVASGVDSRSLHSTRHTFITLARRGGARSEVVERITHNASGTIVDQYTHWDWAPLCEAVLCLIPKADLDRNLDNTPFPSGILVEAPGIEP